MDPGAKEGLASAGRGRASEGKGLSEGRGCASATADGRADEWTELLPRITLSVISPMCSMRPLSLSPGASLATPAGVPVLIRSPGRSVTTPVRKRMWSYRLQIMSLGVRGHDVLAVQLDVDARVLWLGQLVLGDDPRAERGEGVEALADVARVLVACSRPTGRAG